MGTLTRASALAAPAADVWAAVSTTAGVDAELRPWLSMRMPARWRGATLDEVPVGERLGRAWLLLGGVLPVEYDDLTLAEREHGRMFQERSTMLSLRVWEHRRCVDPVAGGCRLTDDLAFEPRWRALEPVAARIVAVVFGHRHRRLVARFGALRR